MMIFLNYFQLLETLKAKNDVVEVNIIILNQQQPKIRRLEQKCLENDDVPEILKEEIRAQIQIYQVLLKAASYVMTENLTTF